MLGKHINFHISTLFNSVSLWPRVLHLSCGVQVTGGLLQILFSAQEVSAVREKHRVINSRMEQILPGHPSECVLPSGKMSPKTKKPSLFHITIIYYYQDQCIICRTQCKMKMWVPCSKLTNTFKVWQRIKLRAPRAPLSLCKLTWIICPLCCPWFSLAPSRGQVPYWLLSFDCREQLSYPVTMTLTQVTNYQCTGSRFFLCSAEKVKWSLLGFKSTLSLSWHLGQTKSLYLHSLTCKMRMLRGTVF